MTTIITKKKLTLKVINNEPEKWPIQSNEKIPLYKGKFQPRYRSHIIQEGNSMYGEEYIDYRYLNPKVTFSQIDLVNLGCKICGLIWITPLSKFLKGKGINAILKNKKGLTPRDIAKRKDSMAIKYL